MKASGEYNPVTQHAGGSVEVSRSDYQERRKDTLMWLMIIIAALVLVWIFTKDLIKSLFSGVSDPVGAVADKVSETLNNAANAPAKAAQQLNQNSIDTVVRAAGQTPGPAATSDYWNAAARYLGEGAIQSTAISAGNVILSTPIINNLGQPLLAQATISGQNFRQALDENNDYERLESDPLKGLIVTGEGLSRTFTGFSPYEAGVAFGGWITGRGGA